jgi:hypothetical protein
MQCSLLGPTLHNVFSKFHNSLKRPQGLMEVRQNMLYDMLMERLIKGSHTMVIWEWNWNSGAIQIGEERKEGNQSQDLSALLRVVQLPILRKSKPLSLSQVGWRRVTTWTTLESHGVWRSRMNHVMNRVTGVTPVWYFNAVKCFIAMKCCEVMVICARSLGQCARRQLGAIGAQCAASQVPE